MLYPGQWSKLFLVYQSPGQTCCASEQRFWMTRSPYISYGAVWMMQGDQAVRMVREVMNQCKAKVAEEREERAANKVQEQKDKKKIAISLFPLYIKS